MARSSPQRPIMGVLSILCPTCLEASTVEAPCDAEGVAELTTEQITCSNDHDPANAVIVPLHRIRPVE